MADKEIKAEATVVLNTRDVDAAAQRVKRANDSVAKDAKKAAAQQTAEQKKLTKEQEREAKKRADAERKLLERQARDTKKALDAQAAEHERYQRRLRQMHFDEVHKRTQQELAEERKSLASREKMARESFRRLRSFSAGAVAAGVAGGAVAVSTARGIAGVEDAGTRLKKANDAQRRLISLGKDAGMSESQIMQMRDTAVGASTKYGKDLTEIVSGLEEAHGRFNLLSAALQDIDNITKTSTAKMMDFADVIGMLGSAKQAFELKPEDMSRALSMILSGTSVGAINAKEFAGPFAPLMGSFALNTKQKGLEGLGMFVAGAEGVGTGQFGGEESATRFKNMISALNDSKVIAKLRAVGIKNFRAKDGTVDLGAFIEEAAKSKQFQSASTRQKIFMEDRAREGVETLMSAREKRIRKVEGAVDYTSLKNTDATAGTKSVEDTLKMFDKFGVLNLDKLAAAEQARTIDQMKNLNTQVEAVAGSFGKLLGWMDEHMGGSGSFLETWGGAIGAGGLGAAGAKALGLFGASGGAAAAGGAAAGAGAGAAGGAVATGGLMATLGTGVAAVGGGALAAGATVGAITGGAVGYGLDKLVEAVLDKKLSTMIGEALPNSDVTRSREAAMRSGGDASAQLVKANKHLERIANAQDRRAGAQPGTGNRGTR